MKNFVLRITFLLFSFVLISQVETRQNFDLLGLVSNLETSEYYLVIQNVVDKNGKFIGRLKEPTSTKKLAFDNNGLLIREFEKHRHSSIDNEYIYNEYDSLVDIKSDGVNNLGKRYLKFITENRKKRMMTIKGIMNQNFFTHLPEQNIYNSNNQIVKIFYNTIPNYAGTQRAYCQFFYQKEKLDAIKCYDFQNNLLETKKYEYKNESIVREIATRSTKKNDLRKILTFNNGGVVTNIKNETLKDNYFIQVEEENFQDYNKTSHIIIDSTGSPFEKYSYQYYLKDKVSEEKKTFFRKGMKTEQSTNYTFDKFSNTLSKINKFEGPEESYENTINYTYKYDVKNNWVIKCVSQEFVRSVAIRKISYYDEMLNNGKVIELDEAISFCDKDYFKKLEKIKKEIESNPNLMIEVPHKN